jgi:hypothetical protein
MHLLGNLACTQDDAEEQHADIDSEGMKDSPLKDLSSEENDEDLECAKNFSLGRCAPVCGKT